MEKSLIDKYKADMLKMYRSAGNSPTTSPVEKMPVAQNMPQDENPNPPESFGKLIAIVTTLRTLYPLENAKITVFTGEGDDIQVLASGSTDQSGRSREFALPTPAKELSMSAGRDSMPYALYNMRVQAEGYVDNIHLNIPVFSGVTSLQSSNMLLLETAGVNKGPQIFDEGQKFNL